jgi:cation:H+ antiporter
MIHPVATKKLTVHYEIPFSLLAALLLGVLANDYLIDGISYSGLTRSDGLVLLSFFIIFFVYIWNLAKITEATSDETRVLSTGTSWLYIILGLVGLIFGGKWIVDGAVHIASLFQVSQSIIGLTVVAIGTSLPELATSAVAAFKKQTDIAIGNIVGSNIFNIFWIL